MIKELWPQEMYLLMIKEALYIQHTDKTTYTRRMLKERTKKTFITGDNIKTHHLSKIYTKLIIANNIVIP